MTESPDEITAVRCPVCELPDAQQWPIVNDYQKIDCDRCGRFEIAGSATRVLASHPGLRDAASRAIHDMPRSAQDRPMITTYTLHELFPVELGSVDG